MRIPRQYPPNAPTSWVRTCRIIGRAIRPRPPQAKRYPLQALCDALGMTESATARLVGLSGSSLVKARDRGLVEQAADRYAVRAGLVPSLVWPDWLDDLEVECAAPSCNTRFVPSRRGHVYCSQRCGERTRQRPPRERGDRRAAQRRYYQETARAQRLKARANYAENSDRIRARQAAYRAANRERIRAQQAAYRAANREQLAERSRARRARAAA